MIEILGMVVFALLMVTFSLLSGMAFEAENDRVALVSLILSGLSMLGFIYLIT